MRKQDDIRIVLGNKRYAGASNQPIFLQIPLIGERREIIQGERSSIVDLQDVFDGERQTSTTFRLVGKIVNIFDNAISGKTNYDPYKNNLYYLDPANSVNTNIWKGYPQYDEFTIIRDSSIPNHIDFYPKSATTYNWSTYVSYVFSSTTAQTMSYVDEKFNVTNSNFNVADGIPFVLKKGTANGKNLIYFYCGTDHNLRAGQYIKLNITINGKNIFQIYGIGDETYSSESRVFSIYNLKFSDNDVLTGTYGNFKRIVNINNSGETTSRYYVRLHKIITKPNEIVLNKLGFENNAFPIKKKLEYSALTPNQVQRVSVKDGTQNYSFTVSKDIDIENLIDNNGKPITELFITMINRGYMGWFNKPAQGLQRALDIGWEFNFLENTSDPWWNHTSTDNKDNITVNSYQVNNNTFYYNNFLNVDDVIKGDFCEYNDIEQQEYVLSPIYHKYSYNPDHFNVALEIPPGYQGTEIGEYNYTNTVLYPPGYFYKPHYSIPIRVFSDYIESANLEDIDGAPFYSFYSNNETKFYWRDLYSYGFIDNEGLGLDIPFINGAHYPFKLINFIHYPVRRNTSFIFTQINQPLIDLCE
jgi:hypothetical protein